MIRIDRLRLRLPAAMKPHAEAIARQIGETLAAAPIDRVGRVERCAVPPIAADPNVGSRAVADIASRGILKQLARHRQ